MKKVLILLMMLPILGICFGFNLPDLPKNATALEAAYFLENNIHLINQQAKKDGYRGLIKSMTIQPILIIKDDSEEIGYFLDFNDDNGYITVGNNFNIYDLVFDEESLIANQIVSNLTYSIYGGYTYEGMIQNTMDESIKLEKEYNGTTNGYILDIDLYVTSNFGKEYKHHESKNLTNMSGLDQEYESIYLENKNGRNNSEGNCGMISAANYLQYLYWARNFNKIPFNQAKQSYDPAINEPNLYATKKKNPNIKADPKLLSIPVTDLRKEAYRINGGPEGLSVWQSRDLLNFAMERFGYSTRFYVKELWSFDFVKTTINNNKALLWSVFGHYHYSNHTMFVSGYTTYLKTGKFLFWTTYDYKEFFILRDGHYTKATYYDFNGRNGNTWLGAFVTEK